MNSQFTNRQAGVFAKRMISEHGDDFSLIVRHALFLCFQRPPTDSEIDRGVRRIEDWIETEELSAEESIKNFCLMALNLNEFAYID